MLDRSDLKNRWSLSRFVGHVTLDQRVWEICSKYFILYTARYLNSNFQENYFGEDQKFTDFYDTPSSHFETEETEGLQGPLTEKEVKEREFDARLYRPFAVTVSVTLHDIQAHLIKVFLFISVV